MKFAAGDRVLVKVSGEALMGAGAFGIDQGVIDAIARDLVAARDAGFEIGVVVGGGNMFRGVTVAAGGMDRVSADHMGMLATVMNGLALSAAISAAGGGGARLFSAIDMPTICDRFTSRAAAAALAGGHIAVFAGGTGNPFFTTDTTAVLRGVEIGARAVLKATQVDGVYDSDPKSNPDAARFDRLSFAEALARDLRVMDAAAIAIARDNRLPIVVFSLKTESAISRVLGGQGTYSVVDHGEAG